VLILGDFVDVPPNDSVRSLAEEETTLPCIYSKPSPDVTVVQVSWFKENSDGTKEQLITAHHENGQTAFGTWSRRLRFKSSEPTVDSSLVLMTTETSDEGKYICQVDTFPLGKYNKEMSLTVWSKSVPISSLDPVILEEGKPYGVAASCRSVGKPSPTLSWDTELNGQSTNRSSDNGAVTSHFSLYPLRGMNGKRLDCLVWHPTFQGPRRIRNKLVVHFPPHAEVTGYKEDWYTGMQNAALRCVSGGNPRPQSFTWTRTGGQLPEGVISHPNGTLFFGRPLSMSDGGLYQCMAKNEVGIGRAEMEVTSKEIKPPLENMLMIIVGAVAGGLLILMLIIIIVVTCHHKPTITTLEHSDYLGRPVLHNNSRRGRERPLDIDEENRLRVETYVRNSTMRPVYQPPSCPPSYPVQSTEVIRQMNGSIIIPTDGGSRPASVTKNHQHSTLSNTYPPVTDDEDEVDEGLGGPASQEHPDDQDSETNSSQVSEAHSTRYQHSNGSLRPKLRPIPPCSVPSPHASIIHKAQIV
uniref:Nectin cell adhesion molecule 4a n=1 Tax=Sphaeramia orbicularis TaxID=375764 RepID=A0A673ABT6_9TELE